MENQKCANVQISNMMFGLRSEEYFVNIVSQWHIHVSVSRSLSSLSHTSIDYNIPYHIFGKFSVDCYLSMQIFNSNLRLCMHCVRTCNSSDNKFYFNPNFIIIDFMNIYYKSVIYSMAMDSYI